MSAGQQLFRHPTVYESCARSRPSINSNDFLSQLRVCSFPPLRDFSVT